MKSGGATLFGEDKKSEDEFVTVSKEYLMELERKANDSEYFRGRVDGMEYVIDSFENAFKRRSRVDGN